MCEIVEEYAKEIAEEYAKGQSAIAARQTEENMVRNLLKLHVPLDKIIKGVEILTEEEVINLERECEV